MKRILPLIILLLVFAVSKAQQITAAYFILNREADGFRSIELELDGKYLVEMSGTGELLHVETLDGEDGSDLPITYYDKYDIHDIEGRLKSIGDVKIAYNNVFDIHAVKGTIKSVGDLSVKYYDVFDLHDPKGKVKSVGEVVIKYHDAFDRKEDFGQIRSISGNSSKVKVLQGRLTCRYLLDF